MSARSQNPTRADACTSRRHLEFLNDAIRDESDPIAAAGGERFLAAHRASLLVLSGPARGLRLPIDQQCTRIGRGPGVDLAFADTSLTRTHAVLDCTGGELVLRAAGPDVGAIAVNHVPLAGPAHALRDGDVLHLGTRHFEVSIALRSDARAAAAASPAGPAASPAEVPASSPAQAPSSPARGVLAELPAAAPSSATASDR